MTKIDARTPQDGYSFDFERADNKRTINITFLRSVGYSTVHNHPAFTLSVSARNLGIVLASLQVEPDEKFSVAIPTFGDRTGLLRFDYIPTQRSFANTYRARVDVTLIRKDQGESKTILDAAELLTTLKAVLGK